MINAAPETVYPVVACPTVCSISLSVRLHECRVDLSMAALTHQRVELSETGVVAVFAGKIRAVSHPLVGCKRKTYIEVWEFCQVQNCQRAIWTSVVGMATVAWAYAALRQHDFVEIFGIRGQLGVAGQAAFRHALPGPGLSMAGGAAPAGLGVRADAAQSLAARLVVERSGAELAAALGDPGAGNYQ